jgi:hypothetical protein
MHTHSSRMSPESGARTDADGVHDVCVPHGRSGVRGCRGRNTRDREVALGDQVRLGNLRELPRGVADRVGCARCATGADAALVPVGIAGNCCALPRRRSRSCPKRILRARWRLRVHPLLAPADLGGRDGICCDPTSRNSVASQRDRPIHVAEANRSARLVCATGKVQYARCHRHACYDLIGHPSHRVPVRRRLACRKSSSPTRSSTSSVG